MRIAAPSDIPTIAELKLKMFQEVGLEQILMDGFVDEVISCYEQMYAAGTARHFVIEFGGQIVACAGVFIKDDIPYNFHRERKYGFLGDVYVDPDHRRKGFARALTEAALDLFREQGIITVRLLASCNARSLYEFFGFEATDQMTLRL